jgi:ribonuclease PH
VLLDQVAAISVGHVDGAPRLDLDYREDSNARVDMNVVATAKGELVELQGTAEGRPVPRAELDALTDLGLAGVAWLAERQREALARAGVELDALMVR